ncbi:MAG: MBL fold metallo-hydrolase [Acidimicrobiales bacterium]|nr:MBL fold metallo-hydrolase [Acidimicrobiales bacterium]MCB9395765.1 MBL fold metallo-hydrolase [Acidimicrobiaceae bacterium]
MADLLDLSSRIIDSGIADQPVNRTTGELSEVGDGLAMVESFSHSVVADTGDGLIAFDASGAHTGQQVVEAIKGWRNEPVRHLVYTHGHADHVGGSMFFADDHPIVVGHQNVAKRMDRYTYTNNWNLIINARQFGGVSGDLNLNVGGDGGDDGVAISANPNARRFLPARTLRPDREVGSFDRMQVGRFDVEFHHARGETDDHLWAYFPEQRWVMTGDFLIWNFPNAGNPQKVQRYPIEWAAALRAMIEREPELLLPAHGLPIAGKERIARVLDDVASALEQLVSDVIAMMNAGETLDTIVHTVAVPPETLAKPYLRPLYDEPEFVVRGIWRQFGGWWDGAASRLKPSPDAQLASAIAELAGGADVLLRRAEQAAADDDLRLACHFADLAGWAAPDEPAIHEGRAAIYLQRRKRESSLMSKGIFAAAARESQQVVDRALGG